MFPDDAVPPQRQGSPPAGEATAYAPPVQPQAAFAQPLEDEPWLPDEELPRRPRRRLLTPLPLSLLAVLLIALGFIAGVLVEKGQGSSGSGTGAGSSTLVSRLRAAAGAGGRSAASPSAPGSAAAGFHRPTVGTVSYLAGSTLYVTNAEGDTLKVTTSPATAVTKNVKAKVSAIHPGEAVTITGSGASGGAISAESIVVGSSAGGFAGLFGGGARGRPGSSSGEQSLFGSG